MSYVFISYSKAKRATTQNLATNLERAGYAVWWDTDLLPGETFAEIIRDKLETCAAAIVVWTEESIRSKFVYAEAKFASERSKLVQVADSLELLPSIPLPFNADHIEHLSEFPKVLAALENLKCPRKALGENKKEKCLIIIGSNSEGKRCSARYQVPTIAIDAILGPGLSVLKSLAGTRAIITTESDNIYFMLGSYELSSSPLAPWWRRWLLGAFPDRLVAQDFELLRHYLEAQKENGVSERQIKTHEDECDLIRSLSESRVIS